MVISVDTGNKMIKTEHYEFNSGIDVLDWKMSGKSLLSYVFPEIDAEQLLPEAKQENDKKTAVVAKASDAENDNGTYIQKDHSEQQLLEKSLQEDHFVNLEGDCEADEAEVLLIKNNYKMFEDLE